MTLLQRSGPASTPTQTTNDEQVPITSAMDQLMSPPPPRRGININNNTSNGNNGDVNSFSSPALRQNVNVLNTNKTNTNPKSNNENSNNKMFVCNDDDENEKENIHPVYNVNVSLAADNSLNFGETPGKKERTPMRNLMPTPNSCSSSSSSRRSENLQR